MENEDRTEELNVVEISADNDSEQGQVTPLTELLDNLYSKAMGFTMKVHLAKQLHESDKFKLMSKKCRNNLLFTLLDDAGDLEDMTKLAFRHLKKVKRERVPEDSIDAMLGIPEHIRNAVRGQDEEQDDTP